MEVKMIDPKSIIPYENNPRKNDNAVKPLMESIQQFGFNVPITVDKNMVVVTGHTRLRAALKLKMNEVPIIVLDGLDDEKIKAFRLADNKLSEIADWDIQKLIEELQGIEIDMTIFGFKKEKSVDDVDGDDYDFTLAPKPKSKLGDIYQLGRHRLICGDARIKSDIDSLMNGKTIDCIITDPPYNVDYKGGGANKRSGIQNDNMNDEAFLEFLTDSFGNMAAHLKPGGSFYVWYGDSNDIEFRMALKRAGLEIKQTINWVKNAFTLGRQDYQWQHEPCIYGWKPGAAHYFIDDRTWSTTFTDDFNISKMNAKEVKEILTKIYEEVQTSVLRYDKPTKSAEHPTMKPVKLIARLMQNSSNPDESILDPFGGSGTTLIVAEQMNRTCFMSELDPKYVDVIINRWEEMTKQKAVKLNNSETMGG